MTIILFLFFLSILILVHELGHFLAARLVKLNVEEFSIGFPPRIISRQIKGTNYSIGLIFLGGFVKLRGENDPNDLEGFLNLPPLKKFLIVISGVLFNIFLAYFFIVFSLNLGYPFESNKIFVSGFLNENTQAYKYFKTGDEILYIKVDDKVYKFQSLMELVKFLKNNEKKEVEIFYLRDNNVLSAKVVPPVGFYLANFEFRKFSFFESIFLGFEKLIESVKKIIYGFFKAIESIFSKEKINLEIIGPIGIYNLFDNVKNFGFGYIFYFLAILSINLAIINLMPFPALDGGRAIFILGEILFKKKIDYQKEELIHQIGFIILFILLIFITIKDIYKLWIK